MGPRFVHTCECPGDEGPGLPEKKVGVLTVAVRFPEPEPGGKDRL